MALARARGCAGRGSPPGHHVRQADASRRRNGPRKATYCRLITVRLRSKSCLAGRYRVSRVGRRAVVAKEAANLSAGECGVEDQVGRASAGSLDESAKIDRMGIQMEIIVRGRHVTVPPRFRQHAIAKLAKLEKLDAKAVRIDVEVSEERNPRQADHRERVELTIRSRGPAIRAEAAADDRYTALDLAFAKLESRLRRASDRRKVKHGDNDTLRSPAMLAVVSPGPLASAPLPSAGERPAAPPGAALNGHGAANGHGVAPPRDGTLDQLGMAGF